MQSEGLVGDFFRKWDDTLSNAFRKEKDFKKNLSSVGNIKKYLKYHQELFQKISIFYKITGSKRNPLINFILPSPARKTNSLNEEKFMVLESICLPVTQRRSAINMFKFASNFHCPISKHTLSRIIFRCGLKKKSLRVTMKNYLNNFHMYLLFPSFISLSFIS